MVGLNIDFSFGELSKFGFGEPQEPIGGTRVPGRGTAWRVLHHTVLYLESKNPKGTPGWGNIAPAQTVVLRATTASAVEKNNRRVPTKSLCGREHNGGGGGGGNSATGAPISGGGKLHLHRLQGPGGKGQGRTRTTSTKSPRAWELGRAQGPNK